ncbi:hydrolase, NUDIX family, partial [Cooperia oncophora]
LHVRFFFENIFSVSRTTGRVLVLQRGATAKFMPNALVFPGGVVTPCDEKLGQPTKIAAIRELFEETGLLLGQKESAANSKELQALQESTKKDPELFKLACTSPPLDDLIEWNTWLTPSSYKRRYMTSFFIARVEGEPEVRMCEREMSHYFWMVPEDCLEKATSGEVILPPPQVYELTRLSQTPGEELSKYSNKTHVMCPQNITTESSPLIASVLPGDHLYIDEDSFNQPPRTLPSDAARVDPHKSTHRAEYFAEPLYAKCKIYMHNLLPKYREEFHQFTTESKNLQH